MYILSMYVKNTSPSRVDSFELELINKEIIKWKEAVGAYDLLASSMTCVGRLA